MIYIALLRGINVGGNKMVGMAGLRDLLTQLGFSEVRSLLQSGNLVFRSDVKTGTQLESLLETETAKRLGVQVDFLVRTAEEWKMVIAQNPFPGEAKRDPGHLLVMFLKEAASAQAVKALRDFIPGREIVRAKGRQLYVVYPDGQGRSRLTHGLIEKKLNTRGTGRNWNTMLKLAALAHGEPA